MAVTLRTFLEFLVHLGSLRADRLLTSMENTLVLDPVVNLLVRTIVWGRKKHKAPKM